MANYYGKFKPTKGAFGNKSKYQKRLEQQKVVRAQVEHLKNKKEGSNEPTTIQDGVEISNELPVEIMENLPPEVMNDLANANEESSKTENTNDVEVVEAEAVEVVEEPTEQKKSAKAKTATKSKKENANSATK